jgi:hypothetical protein
MMENNMKSFKHYLTESKKVYEFKVKIAGDLPQGFDKLLKASLSQFNVESMSKTKRTPIQESPVDFPGIKHQEVTLFSIGLSYPTTSPIVKSAITQLLRMEESRVLVRTASEEAEATMNAESMAAPDGKGAVLGTDYEASNHQALVGDKHAMSFLKDLGKSKHGLEEVAIDSPLNVKAKATKGQKA